MLLAKYLISVTAPLKISSAITANFLNKTFYHEKEDNDLPEESKHRRVLQVNIHNCAGRKVVDDN